MSLMIIRGLPGSGKSFLAKQLLERHEYGFGPFEADQYFEKDGEYRFDKNKLKKAHNWCFDKVKQALALTIENAKKIDGRSPNSALIITSNTFSCLWEFSEYIKLAKEYGHEVTVITCEGNYGSLHNVPLETIAKMKARWESYP